MKTLLILCLFLLFPIASNADDAARVVGNLQVDGLFFSADTNKTVITKPSEFPFPWTVLDSNIYYNSGNVGIGVLNPTSRLEVGGTVKADVFKGDGSFLTNVNAAHALVSTNSLLANSAYSADTMSSLSAAPANPVSGQMYFDTPTKLPMIYNGSSWTPISRNITYTSGIAGDDTDDGYVLNRTLQLNKLMPTSRVRITWSDNLRVQGAYVSCQWEVMIDSAPATPQLKTSLYVDAGLMHRQSTLVGYATGLSSGLHNIQIKVSRPATPTANCFTGWESTFLLEAEEIY